MPNKSACGMGEKNREITLLPCSFSSFQFRPKDSQQKPKTDETFDKAIYSEMDFAFVLFGSALRCSAMLWSVVAIYLNACWNLLESANNFDLVCHSWNSYHLKMTLCEKIYSCLGDTRLSLLFNIGHDAIALVVFGFNVIVFRCCFLFSFFFFHLFLRRMNFVCFDEDWWMWTRK